VARRARKAARVLLKLSGESLCEPGGFGYSAPTMDAVAGELIAAAKAKVQLAVVLGGGNVFRGAQLRDSAVGRDGADRMGMLATVMNAVALRDVLRSRGAVVEVLTGLAVPDIADAFTRERAVAALERGAIVVLAGGTGHPYFTTDTAAALRAVEIGADALLKATKVDGIYSADPRKDPNATRFDEVTYRECLDRKLGVMDQTAFALAWENRLPIVVFDMARPNAIRDAALGRDIGTRVVA
jgi:uridylate kinase